MPIVIKKILIQCSTKNTITGGEFILMMFQVMVPVIWLKNILKYTVSNISSPSYIIKKDR